MLFRNLFSRNKPADVIDGMLVSIIRASVETTVGARHPGYVVEVRQADRSRYLPAPDVNGHTLYAGLYLPVHIVRRPVETSRGRYHEIDFYFNKPGIRDFGTQPLRIPSPCPPHR